MELYQHQKQALEEVKGMNRCAFYLDMGLGKTFTGSEKMVQLGAKVNLVICQKSKIEDWVEHLKNNYGYPVYDLTNKKEFERFFEMQELADPTVGIINYELAWRRHELLKLTNFTLMLDESSIICNDKTKQCKFVLKLKPDNCILLSGTPTSGKYERLWSQCKLLGWNISKETFFGSYIITRTVRNGMLFRKEVTGYKNVEHLKRKLRKNGAVFMKTEEVIDLPEQNEQKILVPTSTEYKKFVKSGYVVVDGKELMADTILTKLLYQRQLCGQYNKRKLEAFTDILESTEDRLIVFYNFNDELEKLIKVCEDFNRPISQVNGRVRDTSNFDKFENTVLLVQFQAGARGGNYQKANKIVYYSLPLGVGSCELWEQSKKRIHRIGQERPCFYYYLLCKNSIETWNLKMLKLGKDITDDLFIKEEGKEK